MNLKVDILGWNHASGFGPHKRWLSDEMRRLEDAGVDLHIAWVTLGQEPRTDSILYIPFQHPTITYLEQFKHLGQPMVIRYHDFLADDGKDVSRLALADLVLTDTHNVRNRLVELGVKNVVVSPLAVNDSDFRRPSEFGVPVERNSNGFVCLWVGSEKPAKNLDGVGAAMSLLPKHYRLRVVSDGRARQTYKNFFASIGISDRVEWLTQIGDKDLLKEYWGANVLVQAEHDCGFGMPVVEAFHCCLPVITGKGTPCEEVAAGYQIASCDTKDPQSIASAIVATEAAGKIGRALIAAKANAYISTKGKEASDILVRALRGVSK